MAAPPTLAAPELNVTVPSGDPFLYGFPAAYLSGIGGRERGAPGTAAFPLYRPVSD